MNIAWISGAPLLEAGGELFSKAASSRYRLLIPARELRGLGHFVDLIDGSRPLGDKEHAALARADRVVFSKLLRDPDGSFGVATRRYREILAGLARPEERVVLDVNDDNFSVPLFRAFYVEAGRRIRRWICSTDAMAEVLAQHVAGEARVVTDPYEGPQGAPKPPPRRWFPRLRRLLAGAPRRPAGAQPLRILWFGHFSNAGSFADVVPQVRQFARLGPVELTCMSAAGWGLETVCQKAQSARDGFDVRFVPWTLEGLWRALEACDLVVLPSEAENRRKLVKSANRLVESIRAGRFAVAHPVPSYRALADYAWVGDDLCRGIDWALSHPGQARARIGRGQHAIVEQFSPAAVALQWQDALA